MSFNSGIRFDYSSTTPPLIEVPVNKENVDLEIQRFKKISHENISLPNQTLKELLSKDFGATEYDFEVFDTDNYEYCYSVAFNANFDFINSLPFSEGFINLLKINNLSISDILTDKINVILDAYINALDDIELSEVFYKSAQFGCLPLLNAIIKNPRFNKIPVNGARDSISNALVGAMEKVSDENLLFDRRIIQAVKLILENKLSDEINPYDLGTILTYASALNAKDIIKLVAQKSQSKKIEPLRIPYVLSNALKNMNDDVAKFILENPKFIEISLKRLNLLSEKDLKLCYKTAIDNNLSSTAILLKQTAALKDLFEDC